MYFLPTQHQEKPIFWVLTPLKFQVDFDLHFLHIRSPIHSLGKELRHFKHSLIVISDSLDRLFFLDNWFILPICLKQESHLIKLTTAPLEGEAA